jgi:pilus assembly protein CpaB
MRERRRRSLVLGGLALLLGGLAASDVAGREAALERRIGPVVPVVVAKAALAAGEPIRAAQLTIRHVPARFAPRGAYSAPGQLVGQRPAAPLPAGADVTAIALADPAREDVGAPVGRGERVAEVVAVGDPDLVLAGARVDVLVTREARPGSPGRTQLALQDVEVLRSASAPGADGAPPARVSASLRVTLRQAVALAAAQSFARELRLLARAAGDRARSGAVDAVG